MCPKKVYTLTLTSGFDDSIGKNKQEFTINPCAQELPQNTRMSCSVTFFSCFADYQPNSLGYPMAIHSNMHQPVSWDSTNKSASKVLAYVDPIIFASNESPANGNVEIKRAHYSIGHGSGPTQSTIVHSPFGSTLTIELLQPDGDTMLNRSDLTQTFDPWVLKLEFEPIEEDKPRMEMMRY